MSNRGIARLIQNHEGNPILWVNEIFENNENTSFGQEQIDSITEGIEMSNTYDRHQTASNLKIALTNHVQNIQLHGRTATAYELYTAEISRKLLVTIIEMLES